MVAILLVLAFNEHIWKYIYGYGNYFDTVTLFKGKKKLTLIWKLNSFLIMDPIESFSNLELGCMHCGPI